MTAPIAPPLSVYRSSDGPERPADLIFVHGLMGSAANTWCAAPGVENFWPKWLTLHANIWVVDYPADLFWWASSGASMALPERARSVLDLLVNHRLGRRPLVFVTHSLGGLLVKQMLRTAQDLNDPNWKRLLQNTRGVVFLGTPHTGAALGTLAGLLKGFGISSNATQLKSNEVHLIDLTAWYSKNARRIGISTLAYYEKGNIKGIRIVDEGSADPRVEDCNPVPSDANHIEICKPRTTSDPVYMGILRFVESLLPAPSTADETEVITVDYNIDNVFGLHRGDTSHYVDRDSVDNAFLGHLIGDMHLCIYGSSKQGKTALRKKWITNQELTVFCDRSWTSIDIFLAILKAANCTVEKNPNDPSFGAALVKIPKSQEQIAVDLVTPPIF